MKKKQRSWLNPVEMVINLLTTKFNQRSEPKKNVTPFVKRQRELTALSKPVLLWDSATQGTYARKLHGELK